MFFYIGFVLCVLGLLYAIHKTVKNRNILSPQIFLFAGILLYLYIPAVSLESAHIRDERYNLSILMGVIGSWIAACVFPYDILDKNDAIERYDIDLNYFRAGAYMYVVYLMYGIMTTIMKYGSVAASFQVDRISNYLGDNVVSESLVFQLVLEGLKIFFYLYAAYLYERKKYFYFIFLCVLPMIHHRFTAVTRYDFIAMMGALVVFMIDSRLYIKDNVADSGKNHNTIQKRKKKIKIFKIGVIGFTGIYLALIFMRVANYTRFGESAAGINLSFFDLFKTSLSNDSLYYEYFYRLYDAIQKGTAELEYGLSWFVYPFVNMIPRGLWAAKPYTAFSARMTDRIYWELTSGNPVVTFSMLGEGYAQFAMLGCFIAPFIFLGVRWINLKQIKKMKYNRMYLLILMFSLLTYMRSEAPVFYSVIDAVWLWIICRFFMHRSAPGKDSVRVTRRP